MQQKYSKTIVSILGNTIQMIINSDDDYGIFDDIRVLKVSIHLTIFNVKN